MIVENRPGLAGTTSVAKSSPDGYTLFLNSNGHTIAGAINKDLQFDPVKDFSGITLIATVPLVMIVPPTSPAKTVKDFVAMAREKPGQLNFANAGVSTTSFLSAEVFKQSRQDQHRACALPRRARGRHRSDAWRCPYVLRADTVGAGAGRLREKSSFSLSILRPAYRKCLMCRRSPRPVLRTSSTSPGSACWHRRERLGRSCGRSARTSPRCSAERRARQDAKARRVARYKHAGTIRRHHQGRHRPQQQAFARCGYRGEVEGRSWYGNPIDVALGRSRPITSAWGARKDPPQQYVLG